MEKVSYLCKNNYKFALTSFYLFISTIHVKTVITQPINRETGKNIVKVDDNGISYKFRIKE